MATRQLEVLDRTPDRVHSPRSIGLVAAYVGTDRLDDGARFRPPPLSCSREPPAAWLTSEHNERLAQQHAADGAPGSSPRETEAAIDARTGWKTIEIFVALLPIGWG
jgi:hypothetical protein